MKKFLISSLIFSFNFLLAESNKQQFSAKEIKLIKIDNFSGNILVQGVTNAEKTSVEYKKIDFTEKCKLDIQQKETTLAVRVVKSALSFGTHCKIDFLVSALPETDIEIDSGSSDIQVKNITGKIEFDVGSGDVQLENTPSQLFGSSGSGDIQVSGLSSEANLDTGSGDISVSFASVPEKGSLDLETGSGDTTVELPKTSKFKTSFESGSGNLNRDLPDSPDAKFTIAVQTGSGDLKIKKAAF